MKYRYIEQTRHVGPMRYRGLYRRIPVIEGREQQQFEMIKYFAGPSDNVEIVEYDKEMPTVN